MGFSWWLWWGGKKISTGLDRRLGVRHGHGSARPPDRCRCRVGLGPAQNTHRDLVDGGAHRLVARRPEKETLEIDGGGAGGKRRISCWWRDWRRGCGREKSDFVLVVGKEEDRG